MSPERFTIGEMARKLGVAVVTLRRWDRQGKLKSLFRTIGGHRRYGDEAGKSEVHMTILYSRVSSHDQKSDLERQGSRLEMFAEAKGWRDREAISDLGSGLNFRKKGLLRLMDMILNRRISRLVLENKDRLLRFGADLIFRLCAARGDRSRRGRRNTTQLRGRPGARRSGDHHRIFVSAVRLPLGEA